MNKKMLWIISIILFILVLLMVVYYFMAGGSGNGLNPEITNENNKTGYTVLDSERTLVVYFSQSGNTQKLAKEVSDQVGGDFRRLEPVNNYPVGNSLYSVSREEQEADARPELKELDINMNDYDTVFIGYPIWWYTYPQIILTFFDEYDMSGKTIVPFVTHGGSAMSGTEEAMKSYLQSKDVTVLDGLAVRDSSVDGNQRSTVSEWLENLGLMEKQGGEDAKSSDSLSLDLAEASDWESTDSISEIQYTTPEGETGYLFIPKAVLEKQEKVPMVVMMMCTGGEAKSNAVSCGWIDKALEEEIIVLAPNYNNYATYSEIDVIMSSVEYTISQYPVDETKVYATGFSNGGAMAVALASEKPEYFAAISAYGWMVDMRGQDNAQFDIPFQVIQGTKEYTYETDSGAMAIMEDEQRAIHSLFLFNEMIMKDMETDYDKSPYWGYEPDEVYTEEPDGREWKFNNFYKQGFNNPFAQFVLIEGATHQPNENEANVAWEFFRHFSRDGQSGITEN